jgi:hypothetical protein
VPQCNHCPVQDCCSWDILGNTYGSAIPNRIVRTDAATNFRNRLNKAQHQFGEGSTGLRAYNDYLEDCEDIGNNPRAVSTYSYNRYS